MDSGTRVVADAKLGAILVPGVGTSVVQIESSGGGPTRCHELKGRRALWVPRGCSYRVHEGEGAVVLPLLQQGDAESQLLTVPRVLDLDPNLDTLAHFADSLGHFAESPHAGTHLVQAIMRTHEPVAAMLSALVPPAPRSTPARALTRAILEAPWKAHELTGFAATLRLSERTLQRQLLEETGRTFSRWRADARLAAGLRIMLAENVVVGVANRVGFGSDASLSRALTHRLGHSPRSLLSLAAGSENAAQDECRPLWVSPVEAAGRWEPGSRRNGISGLGWLARGTVTLAMDGRTTRFSAGDIVRVPAGARHRLVGDADAVLLPYLWHGGLEPSRSELSRLRESDYGSRLSVVAARFAWMRISGPVPRSAWGLGGTEAGDAADRVERAARTMRELVTRHPGDTRSLARWARVLGVPEAALGSAFVRSTGMPFPRWRASIRMVAARRLLRAGATIAAVSSELGYSRVSSFSRAFATAHSVSPSRFRLEARQRLARVAGGALVE